VKILIFGLPGSGKTTLAQQIKARTGCVWFNADELRKIHNDWDFSKLGRIRQAQRMRELADTVEGLVVCDFVAPTEEIRNIFDADISIWMDTIIKSGRFEDTNKIFELPSTPTYIIDRFLTSDEINSFIKHTLNH
jgi:adenylylsulfate kinase